jgi:DNA (cytosine-5)-methyltransferase 1
MTRRPTMGAVFAGIGGFEEAFRQSGFDVKWQVEIEEKAQRVNRRNFPHTKKHFDIRTVGAHNLERVDVLCGGFPCQDLSVAGKLNGFAGERSGLFFEFLR